MLRWEFHGCRLFRALDLYTELTLIYFVSLGSQLEVKTQFCGFEQYLAAQHEVVLIDPTSGSVRFKWHFNVFCFVDYKIMSFQEMYDKLYLNDASK